MIIIHLFPEAKGWFEVKKYIDEILPLQQSYAIYYREKDICGYSRAIAHESNLRRIKLSENSNQLFFLKSLQMRCLTLVVYVAY